MALAEVRPTRVEEVTTHSGLGALLRQARERLGVSLAQISNETKIPKRHLEALEDDNLSVAPGGIYLRAEVRAYARAVHLDENLALTRLARLLNGPESAPEQVSTADRPADASARTVPRPQVQPWAVLLAIVLAAVAVAATSWWRSTGAAPDAGARDSVMERETEPVGRTVTRVATPPTAAPNGDLARDGSRAEPSSSVVDLPSAQMATARVPIKRVPPTRVAPEAARREAPLRARDETQTPEPGAATTELVIATQPPGARVTVNGISWGTSPVTIRHLSPGVKRIRVSLDGYVSVERSSSLVEGRRQRIDVQLRGR